jgi:UDP-N-acetylglucosamine 1-carboxyvinyltransferase
MESNFVVEGLGGKKILKGEIAVAGAKNAVLKALAATMLFEDDVVLKNVPAIEDVERLCELLKVAGAQIARQGSELTVTPPKVCVYALDKKIAERLRASIVLAGPTLARCGEVSFPFPGGCVLGERPIDLFIEGFKAMGAEITEDNSYFTVKTKGGKLQGTHIIFPFVSVTATETLMLAALLAEGETILENAAMEPEIPHLAEFLNSCGASIEGAGTPTIRIVGGVPLVAQGKAYTTLPDRIETGSFIILAALAGSEVTITGCIPNHCGALIALLRRAGVSIETTKDTIVVRGREPNEQFKMISVRTHEYPGFPTDLQAPMSIFMSQASGEGTVLETIFDGRFRYTDDLVRMGADITVMNPHRILIRGPRKLSKKDLESPDLRGGLAYIIAATVADGTSTIRNAYLIDRGYEHIEERLQKLGLNIRRMKV